MYDVAVLGAGPAGSTTAAELSRLGLRVVFLDQYEFPRDKTCGDALTPRALRILAECGLLTVCTQEYAPIDSALIVAPNGYRADVRLLHEHGRPGSMFVVPRKQLDEVLRQHALACGAHFIGPAHVITLLAHANRVEMTYRQAGSTVTLDARLAVVATGVHTGLLLRSRLLLRQPPFAFAARGYYQQLELTAPHQLQFRFDGVPLPGYGWIFPLSTMTANIGIGVFGPVRGIPNVRTALEHFLAQPQLAPIVARALRAEPIKSYPLRCDFPYAPVFSHRVLLVGEAAGLVNPLTGDGIDFALESGQIAARSIAAMFANADFTQARHSQYAHELYRRFGPLFRQCRLLRQTCLRSPLLDCLIVLAARCPQLCQPFITRVLGL